MAGDGPAMRAHVLDHKVCPEAARLRERQPQESLILQMAAGLLQIIPTPGVKGKFAAPGDAKSLGELLSGLLSLLGD